MFTCGGERGVGGCWPWAEGSVRLLGRAQGQALIWVPKCALGPPRTHTTGACGAPMWGMGGVPHRAPVPPACSSQAQGWGCPKALVGSGPAKPAAEGFPNPKSQPQAHIPPQLTLPAACRAQMSMQDPPRAALPAPEQQSACTEPAEPSPHLNPAAPRAEEGEEDGVRKMPCPAPSTATARTSASGGQRCRPQGCAHPLGGAVACTAPFSLAHSTPSQSAGWGSGLQTQPRGSSAGPRGRRHQHPARACVPWSSCGREGTCLQQA